jgi:hypothetical protein
VLSSSSSSTTTTVTTLAFQLSPSLLTAATLATASRRRSRSRSRSGRIPRNRRAYHHDHHHHRRGTNRPCYSFTCLHVKKVASNTVGGGGGGGVVAFKGDEEPLTAAVVQRTTANDESNMNIINKISNKTMVTLDDSNENDSTLLGLAVLLTVPIVWGTYVPVVKVLYQVDPPVPGLIFSTAYFFVAAAASSFGLCLVAMQQKQQQQQQSKKPPEINSSSSTISSQEESKEKVPGAILEDRSTSTMTAVRAGAELGLYLFLGNLLQVIGLKTVPSDRAGFLVQSK